MTGLFVSSIFFAKKTNNGVAFALHEAYSLKRN